MTTDIAIIGAGLTLAMQAGPLARPRGRIPKHMHAHACSPTEGRAVL